MSRYRFAEFIQDIPIEKDIFGNALSDWLTYGWLGYDRPLETYFLQLDKDGDYPTIWYGYEFGEIKSPYFLIALIRKLFNCDIEFNEKLIDKLIKERNDSYKNEPNFQEWVSNFTEADTFWKENGLCLNNKYVQNGYSVGDN